MKKTLRVGLIQMDVEFASPDLNYTRAEEQVRTAAAEGAQIICLPETWNTGFFPKEDLKKLADKEGERTKALMSRLATELNVHIVAGSVSNLKGDEVYNTCYVFDRSGECVCEYDKTHPFTPAGEEKFFALGTHDSIFELDGLKCGVVICYDIRFCELVRSLALKGAEMLFVPAQWADERITHLDVLNRARAIENQMFVACANSCGKGGKTQFGGHSVLITPWGDIVAQAGTSEAILTADADLSVIQDIRSSINVFRDRRPDLYFQGC
ncbi:MAG: carbon-nitrogen family hydrolase [Fretibacterium sp.]|nr:carbon-nitrogen family hydrolase [Fretibacterium sp.]